MNNYLNTYNLNYTHSLTIDNKNLVSPLFQRTLSVSYSYNTPYNCIKNNNKSIANSQDLGQKKGPNPGKVLSRMSQSIQSANTQDKKKVLFVAEDQQSLFIAISQATEKQRAVLDVIFKFMDDDTSTSALLHKTIIEQVPGLSRRTLQRILKHWVDTKIIHSHQKIHAKGQWGANRYSSIYAASTARHYLAHNSSIKPKGLNKTISITSHSKEFEVKKVKPTYKARDPENQIEVKDAWPCREAQKFLDIEAPGYVRQEGIVKAYNALLISQGRTKMLRREYNYGFFAFYKKRKALKAQYGESLMPFGKSKAWKERKKSLIFKSPKIQISKVEAIRSPYFTDTSTEDRLEDENAIQELMKKIRGY